MAVIVIVNQLIKKLRSASYFGILHMQTFHLLENRESLTSFQLY